MQFNAIILHILILFYDCTLCVSLVDGRFGQNWVIFIICKHEHSVSISAYPSPNASQSHWTIRNGWWREILSGFRKELQMHTAHCTALAQIQPSCKYIVYCLAYNKPNKFWALLRVNFRQHSPQVNATNKMRNFEFRFGFLETRRKKKMERQRGFKL